MQKLPIHPFHQQVVESLSPSQVSRELYSTIPWCEEDVKVIRQVVASNV